MIKIYMILCAAGKILAALIKILREILAARISREILDIWIKILSRIFAAKIRSFN